MKIKIFVTEIGSDGKPIEPEYEITDLYWFEENGIHNFDEPEDWYGNVYQFRFEVECVSNS